MLSKNAIAIYRSLEEEVRQPFRPRLAKYVLQCTFLLCNGYYLTREEFESLPGDDQLQSEMIAFNLSAGALWKLISIPSARQSFDPNSVFEFLTELGAPEVRFAQVVSQLNLALGQHPEPGMDRELASAALLIDAILGDKIDLPHVSS